VARSIGTGLISTAVAVLVLSALARCSAPSAPAASSDWVTVNKDYASRRYVALDLITPANVAKLAEICRLNLNEPAWFSSGLLMVNDTLYVNTLRATYAIDATTCSLRWRHVIAFPVSRAADSNRGAAYLDGRIFRGTGDGHVIALDAKTGTEIWNRELVDVRQREGFVAAPIAWQGKVFIGNGVSELGTRAHLFALDARTGRRLWRFEAIPRDNEPGAKTWTLVDPRFPPAGGGYWTTFSLDTASGELFAPIANPFPDYSGEVRPGTNLYTNSVVSLDAATGRLKWYYQATPHDEHDWDLGTAPTLYTTPDGTQSLAIAGKDGHVWGIDRATKALVFKTAGTTIANAGPPQDHAWKFTCPGGLGGAQWTGTAYLPATDTIYSGMADWCWFFKRVPRAALDAGHVEGTYYTSGAHAALAVHPTGWVTAMNGSTGRVLWRYHAPAQVLAGPTTTESGLVFAGDTRGDLFAFDARSGTLLKRIDAGGALNDGLISYGANGTQYVAATVGGLSLNPSGVAGPLRVSIYGLNAPARPRVVTLSRLPQLVLGGQPAASMFLAVCAACHGSTGEGADFPPLTRQTRLGDPSALAAFLASVPPPMARFYPGLLTPGEVRLIARYLKTSVLSTPASGSARSPAAGGTAQWKAIYSVLASPRCVNCHTITDYPRQGNDRHPHYFGVIRGTDDMGGPLARCETCHSSANNNATGIPGARGWRVAPLSMAWESAPGVIMTGAQLCAVLKDKAKNGDRSPAQLVEHVEKEHLVLWAWHPGFRADGTARTKPPISHAAFVNAFKGWAAAGAPCPISR
jgi:alcohol dehydrogenase (cytochrome c)